VRKLTSVPCSNVSVHLGTDERQAVEDAVSDAE